MFNFIELWASLVRSRTLHVGQISTLSMQQQYRFLLQRFDEIKELDSWLRLVHSCSTWRDVQSTAISTLGTNISITSPMTRPTTSGSTDRDITFKLSMQEEKKVKNSLDIDCSIQQPLVIKSSHDLQGIRLKVGCQASGSHNIDLHQPTQLMSSSTLTC